MVVLNRIYTRTGDDGTTALGTGERLIAELKDRPGESVGEEMPKYVNRLSDFLFVAARYANDKGARDVLWVPGRNR